MVVLPAPEAPTRATVLPAGSSRVSPRSASTSPYWMRVSSSRSARRSGGAASPRSGGTPRSSSSNTRSAAPTPATTWVSVEESVFSGPYIRRTAPT